MTRRVKRKRRTRLKETTPLRHRLPEIGGLDEQQRDTGALRLRLDTLKRFVSDLQNDLDDRGPGQRAGGPEDDEELEQRAFRISPQTAAAVREMHMLARACLDASLFAKIRPKTKGAKERRIEALDVRLYRVHRWVVRLLACEKKKFGIPREEMIPNFETALTEVTWDQVAVIRSFDAAGHPTHFRAGCELIAAVLKANRDGTQRSAYSLEKSFRWIAKNERESPK